MLDFTGLQTESGVDSSVQRDEDISQNFQDNFNTTLESVKKHNKSLAGVEKPEDKSMQVIVESQNETQSIKLQDLQGTSPNSQAMNEKYLEQSPKEEKSPKAKENINDEEHRRKLQMQWRKNINLERLSTTNLMRSKSLLKADEL